MTPTDAADPSVLRYGDKLYMYSTGIVRNRGYFEIRTSPVDDRTSWTVVGTVFSLEEAPKWAMGPHGFWAPEVHKVGEKYICYFSAPNLEGKYCIGAAVAEHPAGPYDSLPAPIVSDPKLGLIDVSYFQDPMTSRSYLLWKEDGNDLDPKIPTNIVMQEVAEDGLTTQGEPLVLLKNDAEWEDVLVEAPSVIHHGDYYYLFYSGNVFSADGYATGVARSRKVTGPYEKYPANPILKNTERFSGPGHQFPFEESPGRWTLFYHSRDTLRDRGERARMLMSDEVKWSSDGWPVINDGTPSTTWTLTLP